MNTKHRILLGLILCIYICTAELSKSQDLHLLGIDELQSYGLLIKDGGKNDGESEEDMTEYYIVDLHESKNFWILDSIKTQMVIACDTNSILYDQSDNDSTYLVIIQMAPRLKYDTLIALPNNDPDNWIMNAYSIVCSITDSVLAYQLENQGDIAIIRILANNKWRIIKRIIKPQAFTISYDFTQILICSGIQNPLLDLVPDDLADISEIYINDSLISSFGESDSDSSSGNIIIYDIWTDSLFAVDNAGISNCLAIRKDRNSPIHYLKISELSKNLYTCSERSLERRMTFYEYPYTLFHITYKGDSLQAGVFNQQDISDNDILFFELE
jgi:hypothetical protein